MSEENRRLVRVYKKITVEEVSVWEKTIPETDYTKTDELDSKGENIWKYIPTGKEEVEKNEDSTTLYEQKFDDGDLDVKELTLHVNRVK